MSLSLKMIFNEAFYFKCFSVVLCPIFMRSLAVKFKGLYA